MGGVLVNYTQLGPYSPVRLSVLSGDNDYRSANAIQGSNYRIWMSFNAATPKEVWTTVYGGKHTPQLYQEKWNQAYGNRFQITKTPVVDQSNGILYFEGTAKRTETFGQLALDQAWARLHPWYAGTSLWQKLMYVIPGLPQLISVSTNPGWRGIEQVAYYKILDSKGNDIGASSVPNTPDIPDEFGDETSGNSALSDTFGNMPKIFGINILWIGAAAAVVGGAILLGKKKRG